MLQRLELADHLAELLALAQVGDDRVETGLHDPQLDARQDHAFVIQPAHQHADAAVQRPHHAVFGHEAIVEHQFGGG